MLQQLLESPIFSRFFELRFFFLALSFCSCSFIIPEPLTRLTSHLTTFGTLRSNIAFTPLHTREPGAPT